MSVRLLLALFCLAVVLFAAAFGYFGLALPAGVNGESFVQIPPGAGTRRIAAILADDGVIRSRYAFDLWQVLRGGTLKAGEYRFAGKARLPEVYERLRRGDVYLRTVVIPEGFNVFDVARAMESAQLSSKQSFLAAARADAFLIADLDPGARSLEGYLFPDTYRFERRETPDQILATMVKRFRSAAGSIGLHSDYRRTVTLASLVERETPIAADRPQVASVFENRLAKGMPLMTDPTVIYAALLENRFRGAIYRSDLERDSDYNTYVHAGLPPGPICNPGLASLEAAMHPAKTTYLYFVADPAANGHSSFSTTLEEHQRNVAAYRRGRRAATSSAQTSPQPSR